MKKITFLFFLTPMLIFQSCSSDSDEDSGASLPDEITYGREKVTISSALIEDFGNGFNGYNYDFTLKGTLDGKEYSFYVELYSPVIENDNRFRSGIFSYNPNPTEPAFFFDDAYITVDGQRVNVTGGKITVNANSDTNFEFTTDVSIENGKSMSVLYDGQFTVVSGR